MPPLAGLAVRGVRPAPLAVLAQRDAVRVVALGLVGLVVPALALLAGEGDGDPDISAGHGRRAPKLVVRGRRSKENPAPARGRHLRIAPSPSCAAGCQRPCPSCPASSTSSTPCRPASAYTWRSPGRPTRPRCWPCTAGPSTGGAGGVSSRCWPGSSAC